MARSQAVSTAQVGAAPFFAGKNKIINGDFNIWQRGTSFSTASGDYTADRWQVQFDGSGATRTISRQSFTLGTAPVAGYESPYFLRFNQSVAGSGSSYNLIAQKIEDVRTFANQTVTVSFWAKAASTITLPSVEFQQYFGTGGSPSSSVFSPILASNISITTSWQRFSYTANIASIAGKTIGTDGNSHLALKFLMPINATFTFDIWGVQVEAGSVATAFQTATGTLAGELAACQRYYYRLKADAANRQFCSGMAYSTGFAWMNFSFPVEMRTRPTALEQSGTAGDYQMWKADSTKQVCSNVPIYDAGTTTRAGWFYTTTGSGLVAGNATILEAVNSSAYLGWSAEL